MVEKGRAAVDEVLLLIACLTVILGNLLHDSANAEVTQFCTKTKKKTPEFLDSGVSAMAES